MFLNRNDDHQSLPHGWERAYDVESRRYFYINHASKETTWLNPLDRSLKPKHVCDCSKDQLPYGWERIVDPDVGVYYANHLEWRNQWTNPVTEWHLGQHHYSNSDHQRSIEASFESRKERGEQIKDKPETPAESTSDVGKSITSLNNSTAIDSRSSHSARSQTNDARFLDLMDNNFGRDSSDSVEV